MQKFVNVVIPPINQSFTYGIDPLINDLIRVGSQVHVSFGNRHARAFVVSELTALEISNLKSDVKFKIINSENKVRQCFDERDLTFFSWVAEYYGDSLANIIDVAIPSPAKKKIEKSFELLKDVDPASIKSKPQRDVYNLLKELGGLATISTLREKYKSAAASGKNLAEAGLICINEKEVLDRHISNEKAPSWTKSKVSLNDRQLEALQLINKSVQENNPTPILLHGITGSGKTEVYIEAIQECIKSSKGVLILVPEIALTPQLIDRFRARLGHEIAILHSALNKSVRWDSWRALLEKRNFVAIGARSAVFAPVPNLGLIVIDEEHDSSYKQSEGLRYNARDIAIMRAKILECPIILGSATPSLETFNNALQKRYFYKPLPKRHSAEEKLKGLDIKIVDMGKIKHKEMPSKNISPVLLEAIKKTLDEGGQTFILYNRRGFASYLQCDSCEHVETCPNCSVTFTFHKRVNNLLCHYCALSKKPMEKCEKCSKGSMSERGAGTEKVFEELKDLLPGVAIDRLDRDSVSNLEMYKEILNNVRDGKTKILVGTQMIAKGHDLPGVTLVGIVDCDVGLHLPDFRSSEKTFQLLTQAAGRAGRGTTPGRVILQTRVPKHHSLVTTLSQNFVAFAETELRERKALNYPPFMRLLRIVSTCPDKNQGSRYLLDLKKRFVEILGDDIKKVGILGPAEAPLEKIKNQFRSHMLIKSGSVTLINKIVRIAAAAKAKAKKIKLVIDVDPQDML